MPARKSCASLIIGDRAVLPIAVWTSRSAGAARRFRPAADSVGRVGHAVTPLLNRTRRHQPNCQWHDLESNTEAKPTEPTRCPHFGRDTARTERHRPGSARAALPPHRPADAEPSWRTRMCLPAQPHAPDAAATGLAERAGTFLAALAAADASTLTAAEQAECLLRLEQAESRLIAARATMLAAFEAQRGYELDGQASAQTWLAWQARITR